jgi:xylulokinase
MGELLLGVDVGTYSSKGVLVSPDGRVLKSQVVEHGLQIPHPGWAEQDADGVWWADVVAICRGLLDGEPYTGADVAAVSLSAIGPCLLPLDREGRPLRPGILYGVDTRATEEIEFLERSIGPEELFRLSGMALSSQAVGPKILWLKRHEPEVWRQTARLTTASSYLTYRLTGEHVMDRHTASHYIPLFDLKRLEWTDRYAREVADPSLLPRLGFSDELAGEVSPQGARETGLKAGTPVAVGAVDALAEAVSVGVAQPGDLMLMYGSTAFFILVQESPTPDPRLWTVAGARRGQYNLAAGMATSGSLTRWFRDELARDLLEAEAYERLYRAAEGVPPGSRGLLVLPYFSGERTPINDPKARGLIAGLSLSHRREELFRAALEGVGYGIRHNLETFREIGAPLKRVVAVGGGTKGRTWLQIVCDISGQEQLLPEVTIGASYGDAFLAGVAGGLLRWEDLEGWVRLEERIVPDPTHQARYDELYRLYLELYSATRDLVHRLAEMSQEAA